jgi:hypothetical protein
MPVLRCVARARCATTHARWRPVPRARSFARAAHTLQPMNVCRRPAPRRTPSTKTKATATAAASPAKSSSASAQIARTPAMPQARGPRHRTRAASAAPVNRSAPDAREATPAAAKPADPVRTACVPRSNRRSRCVDQLCVVELAEPVRSRACVVIPNSALALRRPALHRRAR